MAIDLTMSEQAEGVSVVIPYYNGHRTILRALESVRSQTYRPVEAVIVDDASDEPLPTGSLSSLSAAGLTVKYLRNPANVGTAGSRNLGAAAARYELLIFLDQDDWLLPLALDRCVVETRPRCLVAFDNFLAQIDTKGQVVAVSTQSVFERARWHPMRCLGVADAPLLMHRFPMVKVLVRKADFVEIGGYNEALVGIEDYFFVCSALARGIELLFVEEPLGVYAENPLSTTAALASSRRAYLASRLSWLRVWCFVTSARTFPIRVRLVALKRVASCIALASYTVARLAIERLTW